MDHLIESVNLKIEVPEVKYSLTERAGGAWPLFKDTTESWAWSDGVFSTAELDAIINIGQSIEAERASTFGGIDSTVRDSYVNFIYPSETTSWVFEKLAGSINLINSQYFKFDLQSMEQGLQFTRYQAPGEHYEWHIDRGMGMGTRKLSLSLQLSDPDDYEGGDLELWYGGTPVKASRQRGIITFFPSYVMHRVTPVTKGVRYSLVCWISGPQFK
jgi:PKHD-type hydroxylase